MPVLQFQSDCPEGYHVLPIVMLHSLTTLHVLRPYGVCRSNCKSPLPTVASTTRLHRRCCRGHGGKSRQAASVSYAPPRDAQLRHRAIAAGN